MGKKSPSKSKSAPCVIIPSINIYIPSQPIAALVHDNEGNDLFTYAGAKIQSQLSSSSLELTVIHGGEAPDDEEDEEDN